MNNKAGVLVRPWVIFKNQKCNAQTCQFMSNKMHPQDVSTNRIYAEKNYYKRRY